MGLQVKGGVILGTCAGLASITGISATIWRILFALGILLAFGYGFGLFGAANQLFSFFGPGLYILLWLIFKIIGK